MIGYWSVWTVDDDGTDDDVEWVGEQKQVMWNGWVELYYVDVFWIDLHYCCEYDCGCNAAAMMDDDDA